jgi:D-alanine-D-alanine ligase
MSKMRVGVIYGGRSGEHEVSIASAASILTHLDRSRYEPVAVKIEKDGRWTLPDRPPDALSAARVIEDTRLAAAHPLVRDRDTLMPPHPGADTLITIEPEPRPGSGSGGEGRAIVTGLGLDVVFPVLHGPYGEDGTVQGLLELANVPYVGSGVMASAVGMDKAVMKVLFQACGLPVSPWVAFTSREWSSDAARVTSDALALGLPLFVKPANLGSSVGISKVKAPDAFARAMDEALSFDRKAVVEAGVADAREIECGVIGNEDPEASVAGEIVPSREFYDYDAKYLDDASQTLVPADLAPDVMSRVRALSIAAFRAVEASGLARVDFLLSRSTESLLVNEINTMPGFTTISMFAKLWEASGVPYPALVDRLIALALARHAEKQRLRTSVL